MMRRLLTFFMLLAMAIPLWAGEKTVTISRNEGIYEDANGVYYCTKGGITMTFSSGLNNVNYLVEHQQIVFDIFSTNYVIKKIKFNCLDNTTNDNLDCFYWGPSTIHECTRNPYVPTGSYSYSGYIGTWVGGSTPSKYVKFETEGKPVRFGSVEITYEKEFGDIYEKVTTNSELQDGQTYVLVSQYASKALGKEDYYSSTENLTTFTSTPVTLLDNNNKVKVTDEVQLIKLQQSGNSSRPWYIKVGDNYLRRRSGNPSGSSSGPAYGQGYNLYTQSTVTSYEQYFRVSISVSGNTNSNALIRFEHNSSETAAPSGGVTRTFAIRHYNGGSLFRDIDYSSNNQYSSNQRVYLYKPAQSYEVTTECDPTTGGYITLGNGIITDNQGKNWSQHFDNVTFFVGATDGWGIGDVTVTNLTTNEVTVLPPIANSDFGNDYIFTMPSDNVHIVAHFTEPHVIHTVVDPTGSGEFNFINGYTDFNGQTTSNDGKTVTFSVTPEEGYEFNSLTYTDDVTGVTTTLTPDENGVFSFVMPDNDVTLTANFDPIPFYSITTTCTPPEGGHITLTGGVDGNNMAQGGETVTLDVGTNWGWTISEVVVTNNTTGESFTITPVATTDAGNSYSFVMPNGNVTIEASFYASMPSLYLLGTAMGRTSWVPAGPRFDYSPATGEYYLEVYFKGGNDDANSDQDYGYFSLARDIDHSITWQTATGGDWTQVTGRLAAVENNTIVQDGSTNVALYGDRPNNAFKIPAGVYTIYVSSDMTRMRIVKTPLHLFFDPVSGSTVELGQVVTISSDLQTTVHGIAQRYSINNEVNQSFKNTTNNWATEDPDNTAVLTQLGTTTVKAEANIGYIVVPGEAVYNIVPVNHCIEAIWSPVNAGSVTVASTAIEGETVTFSVDPNSGYAITSLTITGSHTGQSVSPTDLGGGNYSFVMPDDDVIIIVNFSIVQYNVHTVCNPPEGGSIDGAASASVAGATVTFTVSPQPGFEVNEVTLTNEGTNVTVTLTPDGEGNYSFTMPESSVTITAYFASPLSEIENTGTTENIYTVSDELIGTWVVDDGSVKYLWAKDQGNKSNEKVEIPTDQVDYMVNVGLQKRAWDQSNWVILDFQHVNAEPEAFLNKTISAGTIRGVYADDVNYRIELTEAPVAHTDVVGYPGYNGDYNETSTHPDSIYYYNQYMSFNFLPSNLVPGGVAPGTDISPAVDTSIRFFFMNPKIQEVTHVMGVWIEGDMFSVFNREGNTINGYDLDGIFKVNWDYNRLYAAGPFGKPSGLTPGTLYSFHAAVFRDVNEPSGKMNAAKPNGGDNTPSYYEVYPFDLPPSPSTPTAVKNLTADKVVDSIRYYNIMGVESTVPFQGVNIMVVRYTDGSSMAVKIVK